MTVSQLPLPPAAPVTPSSSAALPPSTEGGAVSPDEQMACTEFAAGSAAVYAECIRKRAFGPGGRITNVSPSSLNPDEKYCHTDTAMISGMPVMTLFGKITNSQRSIYVKRMSDRGYTVTGLPGRHTYVAELDHNMLPKSDEDMKRSDFEKAKKAREGEAQQEGGPPVGNALGAGTRRYYYDDGEGIIVDIHKLTVEVITRTPACDVVFVNGAVGRIITRGSCGFPLFAAANLRQVVEVQGDLLRWSYADAGSGLITALNQGTGGAWATLNMRNGRTTSSLGDSGQCQRQP
jgi:hypothetical protein